MKIKRYALMYCGIQPSEIDKMDAEDFELFAVFFSEMKRNDR